MCLPANPEVHAVATATHGRALVRRAEAAIGIIAGFHGYYENAAMQLQRLASIPGADRWTLVSVQALNRVYHFRTEDVVAGWMTTQDREIVIADNIAYVSAALRVVPRDPSTPVVYAGFSQGGQMAFRAAVGGDAPPAGIISVGSDVPPELLADPAAAFPPVLLMRGTDDTWYTQAKHEADIGALRARGVPLTPVVLAGGHQWTSEAGAAAGEWLARLR